MSGAIYFDLAVYKSSVEKMLTSYSLIKDYTNVLEEKCLSDLNSWEGEAGNKWREEYLLAISDFKEHIMEIMNILSHLSELVEALEKTQTEVNHLLDKIKFINFGG